MLELPVITPHLTVQDAKAAIEFYTHAFEAEEIYRMPTSDDESILHAELQIGNSTIYLNDEFPDFGVRSPFSLNGSPVTIHLQVDNADTWFNRAVSAGAKVLMPLEDTFWGDRYGKLIDPFGHHWSIASHIEDVAPADIYEKVALESGNDNSWN